MMGAMPAPRLQFGDFYLSLAPSFGIGSNGFGIGAGIGAGYDNGEVSFGVSYALRAFPTAGESESRLGGGIAYNHKQSGQTFSLAVTSFGGKDAQALWQVGYRKGDFSMAINEDWQLSGDKYRTFGMEAGIGDFSLGATIYTTEGRDPDKNYWQNGSMWGKNRKGTYTVGKRIYSSVYIGYRDGNSVYRLGIDAPGVQDFFQNGFHRIGSNSPYFRTDYETPAKAYIYHGSYDPYSLY